MPFRDAINWWLDAHRCRRRLNVTIDAQMVRLTKALLASGCAVALGVSGFAFFGQATAQTPAPPADHQRVLTQYCQGCHNDRTKTGNFSVQQLRTDNVAANDAAFEKILRKVK